MINYHRVSSGFASDRRTSNWSNSHLRHHRAASGEVGPSPDSTTGSPLPHSQIQLHCTPGLAQSFCDRFHLLASVCVPLSYCRRKYFQNRFHFLAFSVDVCSVKMFDVGGFSVGPEGGSSVSPSKEHKMKNVKQNVLPLRRGVDDGRYPDRDGHDQTGQAHTCV